MASEVKFDLRIEINNLNYHGIYVHVASNYHFGGLWGHGGLKTSSMASEFKFDLTFEISNLNYPGIIVHVTSNSHFVASEAMEASKQPQRSHLTS